MSAPTTTTSTPANTARAAFIPPAFSKFGKQSKDLLKKNYDFHHGFKSLRKTTDGVTFESGAIYGGAGVRGFLKAVQNRPKYSAELELNSDVNEESKLTLKFDKVAKGLLLTAAATTSDADFKGASGRVVDSIEAEYGADYFCATASVKSNLTHHHAKASAVVGVDGFSVGGNVALDVTNGVELNDYNAGVQYQTSDYVVSAITERRLELVGISGFYRAGAGSLFSGRFATDLHGSAPTVAIGHECQLNPSTTVRAKVEIPSGVVSTSLTHNLYSPQIQVTAAAQFETNKLQTNKIAASKFGFNIVAGDF